MEQDILIVDAHPVYREKIFAFLRGLTFENIRLSGSGEGAIAAIQEQKPDLLILSSILPDTDSLDLCQAIKKASAATKIIVQTGLFTEDKEIAQFKKNGANVVLTRKEKELEPLQSAIESLLSIEPA